MAVLLVQSMHACEFAALLVRSYQRSEKTLQRNKSKTEEMARSWQCTQNLCLCLCLSLSLQAYSLYLSLSIQGNQLWAEKI